MLAEKKLTAAEKKKKEEIVLALKRDNPNMPKDQMYAIATAQAKKVAESKMLEKKRLLLTDDDIEEGSPSFNYMIAKATVEEPEKNFVKIGGKNIRKTMDMKTARRIVKDFENQKNEAQQDFNFKARITPRGDTFEIGGDVFVKEMVDPPKHRYVNIVEKVLNLNEQTIDLQSFENRGFSITDHPYKHAIDIDKDGNIIPKSGLVQYKGFPGWERGTWGKDFYLQGFDTERLGEVMPLLVSRDIVSSIQSLHGAARKYDFPLVFSIPADTGARTMSPAFKSGRGLIFKHDGYGSFENAATPFTIELLENGFKKIKWLPNFRGKGFGIIMAEYTGKAGAQIHLNSTSSNFEEGPVWNLHKSKINFNTGDKYRVFFFDDVINPIDRGSESHYGVEASRKRYSTIGNLGRLSVRLPYTQFNKEIYGDDSVDGYTSDKYLNAVINLSNQSADRVSTNGLLRRSLNRDNNVTVSDVLTSFGVRGADEYKTPSDSITIDSDSSSISQSSTGGEERQSFFGSGDSSDAAVSSPASETPSEKSRRIKLERESKLREEILLLARNNNIEMSEVTSGDIYNFNEYQLNNTKIELQSLIRRKRNQPSTNSTQTSDTAVNPEKALISTTILAFLTAQWQNIKSRFGQGVSQTSEEALNRAMKLLKDAINPNSDLGKKIYTTQNITIAALIAAGSVSYFMIRRFLRNRDQLKLSKQYYGDFGARRELQSIMRRSGLDKVPPRDLQRMLPELERYELTQPSIRRLYDL